MMECYQMAMAIKIPIITKKKSAKMIIKIN